MTARREMQVDVEGHRLKLSNLDKVFYPATGFTKGQVIDYYIRIAPALLPHLADRPLTLKRYPNGVTGSFFYEKRCPSHRPPWVRTEAVWSEGNQDVIRFCVVDDLATLVWLANIADLEMHTYLHRAPRVDDPTMMVFDLDPGPPADAVQCCEVALLLHGLFDHLGLAAFPKTSGSKGVQVYVPLNTPAGYGTTKAFARAVAELLEAQRPDLVVSSMKKAVRVGKVLVDWSQNDEHKTTVCAWSLRAKDRPTVSTPLSWQEVEDALRARDAARLVFDASEAIARFERSGDAFAPVLTLQQRLPAVRGLGGAAGKRRGAARNVPSDAAPPPRTGVDGRQPELSPESEREIDARQRRASARSNRRGRRDTQRPASERWERVPPETQSRPATPRPGRHPPAKDGYLSSK